MRRRLPDVLIILLLFVLPLIMFWQQTVGGKTLLPAENLYQWQPYAAYREQLGVPEIPHNMLLSDLVLENYQWKSFIRTNLAQGEFPLWNPHQFSGIPFFAAGQQSTLYPFNLLYYVLPLPAAYGWFTVLQLWLAGVFMYLFVRGLGVGRAGGAVAGVTYQLSAFFVISAVFPMIIGGAVWLPLLLLMAENIIEQRSWLRGRPSSVPWVAIGAIALGCNILAGHVEITYYTLLILAYYAVMRLVWQWWRERKSKPPRSQENVGASHDSPLRNLVRRGFWLAVMVALGIGIGAVQFIPLYEFANINFRVGSASFDQVLGWAHPPRDVIQFAVPNFYGSPAHHSYFDVFTGQTVSLIDSVVTNTAGQRITNTEWGMKNYVEGALYVGILPLALAVFALVSGRLNRPFYDDGKKVGIRTPRPPYRLIFVLLGLFSLTFMFGLPTYALLYVLPGIDQLHSPFRWIFALTLSVAALAGFGMDALENLARQRPVSIPALNPMLHGETKAKAKRWARRFGYAFAALGVLVLAGLLLSRIFYGQIEALIQRLLTNMALPNGGVAGDVFVTPQMFYSYQFPNFLVLGLVLVGSGAVFLWATRSALTLNPSPSGRGTLPERSETISEENPHKADQPVSAASLTEQGVVDKRKVYGWQLFAVALIAVDLMIASWGFNPASDPAWLDFMPPSIAWLQEQPGEWRYTTLVDRSAPAPDLFNANMTLRYGLDDVRGYESIIPKQYVDFMQIIAPQTQLDFNRVAPLYTNYAPEVSDFDYRDALTSPLLDMLNIRYVITHTTTSLDDVPNYTLAYEDQAVRIWENTDYAPRASVQPISADETSAQGEAVEIERTSSREMLLNVSITEPSLLVVRETYLPGWRAYASSADGSAAESLLDTRLVNGNFMGVELPDAGDWIVRLVYSPQSFQVGLFTSFMSGIVIMLLVGGWLWRIFVAHPTEAADNRLGRLARNSLAPILLNLFNRGIDFAFAIVMLRVLGPEGSGNYSYAVVIFVWFDIFTNFGLYVYLTREVSRDRSRARLLFFNTSIMRLGLALLGVPLLLGFLGVRQSAVSPPLEGTTVLAILLLYIGLLPNNISTGLTSLYYAFERAETPAAVTTIATICKAVFGLAALLLGWGIVGLAAVSNITNLITLAILWWNARDMLRQKEQTEGVESPTRVDGSLIKRMAGESWPLMLNHFLATIFFQIDIILIEAFHGSGMVGLYSVAYKWVLAINVIPSFFTQALLPIMSRQAHEDRAGLKRNYTLAIKLLVSVALPTAVIFTFMATPLVAVLGGSEYLPDSAIATQLMIWSIPIGWINSLTQYVLIALDLQRRITTAFIIGVTFNIVANLIFIPQYGYRAAAIITILSELALLIPFAILLNRAVGKEDWLGMIWRPLVAAAAMFAVFAIGWSVQPIVTFVIAVMVYAGLWFALRALTPEEWARLTPLIPARLRQRFSPEQALG